MALNYENIKINKELEQLLPPLLKEDYSRLEDSLLKNGFQEKFGRIKLWCPDKDDATNKSVMYIVDGHNRYNICKKHNIELSQWCYEFIFFESKEEVIKWMFENQLARRNLSDADKYEVVEKLDNRMNDIDKEISKLHVEHEALMRRRSSLFEALDIECELKYEFVEDENFPTLLSRKCIFFIELDGHREIFVKCYVNIDETPDSIWIRNIPEKYKNDFIMLWKKAHFEEVEEYNRRSAEQNKKFTEYSTEIIGDDIDKDFYKKCFRILAKNFHPDNTEGSIEDMKSLNELKTMWGI